MNAASGDAWPSQKLLAADLGMSVRSIQNALGTLETLGHITVQGSRGETNHYRLRFEAEGTQSAAYLPTQSAAGVDPGGTQSGARGVRNPLQGGYAESFVHNPLNNPLKKNPEVSKTRDLAVADSEPAVNQLVESTGNQPAEPTSEFEIWWQQYPKRVAKATALKAYRTVVTKKLVTTEELLTGAMRYSAERSGQDHKYTKHPATWLNAGSWADEPDVPTRRTNRGDSAIDGMRGFLEDELCPPHIYRNVL